MPPPYLSPIRKDHHNPRHLVGKQFVNNLATQKKELPLNHDKYTNRQTQNTSSALSSLSTRGCPRQIPLLAAFSSRASYLWAIMVHSYSKLHACLHIIFSNRLSIFYLTRQTQLFHMLSQCEQQKHTTSPILATPGRCN